MSSVADLTDPRHKRPANAPSRREASPETSCGQGIAYVTSEGMRRRGMCTCNNWSGRPHVLKALAVLDAQLHAINSGCELAFPLVAPRGMTWVATC